MSDAVVATPDSAIVAAPEAPVTSSNSIPERTPEQKAAGLEQAAERAEKKTLTLPPDAAKPSGKPSKLPDAEGEDAPVETPTKTDAPAEETPKVDEKNPNNVPPKYLNDDGTPDYKKLSDAYQNLEKALSKKGFSNVAKPEELAYTPGKDALPLDPANLKAFQEKAFAAGMTKEQFSAVMTEYETLFKANDPSPFRLPSVNDAAAMAKVKTTLEGIFGKGDDYTDGLNRALKTVENYLPSQFKVSDPVFNHPAVVSLLAAVGKELGEDRVTGQDKSGQSTSGLRTPAEIRALPDYRGNEAKYDAEMLRWYKAQPGGNKTVTSSQTIRK
jgi:hypothetical protein